MKKSIILFLFLIVCNPQGHTQGFFLHGVVRDVETQEPVSGVNIRIGESDQGTFTNNEGKFSLSLRSVPCTVTFSCIGYESTSCGITSPPAKPVSIFLQRSSLLLREVDIRANRYDYIFRDEHYSILDYEVLDTNLLLLVFRYRLKNAELVLLTLKGDTLAKTAVPEYKPAALYKDCLDHVHYFSSSGNAYQCRYNANPSTLDFPYHTTRDSLLMLTRQFLFRIGDRLYFEEFTADGLGKNIGYCDWHGKKRYLLSLQDDKSRAAYRDEVRFNNQWNQAITNNRSALTSTAVPETGSASGSSTSPLSLIPVTTDQDLAASAHFFYQKIRAPLIKLSEEMIAIFDVPGQAIHLFTPDGKPNGSIHFNIIADKKDNLLSGLIGTFIPMQEWEWTGTVLADPIKGEAYTTYEKKGMVRIRKINLTTGEEGKGVMLFFPFPEKIRILNNQAFYLIREACADFPRRRLISQALW